MASTNIQTFPGKVGVSNTNPVHTLDIGSNVYIDDTGANKLTITGNIHASGITIDGDITVIDTQNLAVKDPIILLASESTGTTDTGIIMKRADGDSNVAVFYDEGIGLKIGHTFSGAEDTEITVDTNNTLSTSIYGPVTIENTSTQALSVGGGAQIDGDFQVGEVANLFVDTTTSNVGIGTAVPAYDLDVVGNVHADYFIGDGSAISAIQSSNVSDFASNVTRITNLESGDMTIDGEKTFSSNLEVGTANLFVDTQTGGVGVGTTAPGYTLDVVGDINLSGGFYQGGAPFVSSLWIDGGDSLYYRSNVEVGTANLFVDTTKGYVGIGTTTPTVELDIVGNVYVSNNISGNSLTLNTVSISTTTGLDEVLNVGNTSTNTIQITNISESVSNTTGAVVVSGGVGVGSNLFVGKDLTVSGTMTINAVSLSTTTNFQEVTNDGNTTTNTIEFNNPTTSLVASGNVEVGTANLFVDTTTGNVGVGTSSAEDTLHVEGGNILLSDDGGRINDIIYAETPSDPASNGNVVLRYDGVGSGAANKFYIGSLYPSWPQPGEGFTYQPSTGNVGIGTVTPGAKLDVNGNIYTSSTYIRNVFYAPSNWGYSSTSTGGTTLWSFTFNAPVNGYIITALNGHWQNSSNGTWFYGAVTVDGKEYSDSSLFDAFTGGGSSINGGNFHEYRDSGATWQDLNHTACYYVSSGNRTIGLYVRVSGGTLNVNGAAISLLFIPKNYM